MNHDCSNGNCSCAISEDHEVQAMREYALDPDFEVWQQGMIDRSGSWLWEFAAKFFAWSNDKYVGWS